MTSDLSGTLSLQSNGVAVTVPAVAGTMMVSGNMPAFSATGAAQAVSATTQTKLTFNATDFNTGSYFSTANSRFLPLVAGYYQFNVFLSNQDASANTYTQAFIYRSSVSYAQIAQGTGSTVNYAVAQGSIIMYMNGTTDYAEIYNYNFANATNIYNIRFTGCLVRAA
jgi:hypothetical protein